MADSIKVHCNNCGATYTIGRVQLACTWCGSQNIDQDQE